VTGGLSINFQPPGRKGREDYSWIVFAKSAGAILQFTFLQVHH
jgi:hypothetical protein